MINYSQEFENIQIDLERARALSIVIQGSLGNHEDMVRDNTYQLSVSCLEEILTLQIDKIDNLLKTKIM